MKGSLRVEELSKGKISNPLQVRYWSVVPYQLGISPERQAIKFSVKPSSAAIDPIPNNPSPNYYAMRYVPRSVKAMQPLSFWCSQEPRTV